MRLDLANGWQLVIAIERDTLGVLLWVWGPDGRHWDFGCQRDDWTLGPDSRIVEPLALLQPEQRQQLEQLLREAFCWPAPLLPPDQAVFSGLMERELRGGKSWRWRQRPRARYRWQHGNPDSNQQQKT